MSSNGHLVSAYLHQILFASHKSGELKRIPEPLATWWNSLSCCASFETDLDLILAQSERLLVLHKSVRQQSSI